MLAELREKSQMTLPKPLVDRLNLKAGDRFDVSEMDGVITLVPMELYPRPAMRKVRDKVSSIGTGGKADVDALAAIRELFGSMSDTAMSADSFAASKRTDLELE
jgi:AbrB family looped-hinge helix DNA binding protein